MKVNLFFFSFLLCASLAYTQHNHDHGSDSKDINHILACRSGVNFVENLPSPKIMDGIGSSVLKIKTNAPLAQKYFNQGVSLLHCFWDFEAFRSFKESIRHDSTSIMPYWGLLHTIVFIDNKEFDSDKEMAIAKLKELLEDSEGNETQYAKGILDFVETEKPKGYIKHLENIVHQNPSDVDAKLFLALFNMSGYNTEMNPNEGNMYAEYLLRDLLRTDPDNHGVHHYWIHQMENCCPEEALESADKLAMLAPNSGHIVHMPGHIYYKIGDYKKAHDQFVASMKVDSAYMNDQGITEVDNWNYIHNLNYLLANCAQDGRYEEGLHYAERLENMVSTSERLDMHRGSYFYQGIIVPAMMEMRFGFWDRAVKKLNAISDPDSLYGAEAMSYKEGLYLFSEGMAALEKNDIERAQIYSDKLDAHFWRASQEKAKKKGISPELKVASVELAGNILFEQKELDEAIKLLEKAAKMEKDLGYSEPPYYPRPVLISLASAYVKMEEYDKAEKCLKKLLQKHPNSALAYWGLMNVYKANKQEIKLKKVKSKFETVTQYGNPEVFR